FYEYAELVRDKKDLLAQCEKLVSQRAVYEKMINILDNIPSHNDNEQLLQQVLRLREHVAALNNVANHAYHTLLADYCQWGMQKLAEIRNKTDIDIHHQLRSNWTLRLQNIEKAWIEI